MERILITGLENKYKLLIPLWEDGKQNIRKTPWLYINDYKQEVVS